MTVPDPHVREMPVRAETVTYFACGCKLSYYPVNGNFILVCGNKAHGVCTFSCTSHRPKGQRKRAKPWQGRPLGHLAAVAAQCRSCVEHKDHGKWVSKQLDREQKRDMLEADPRWASMLAHERKLRKHEPREHTCDIVARAR